MHYKQTQHASLTASPRKQRRSAIFFGLILLAVTAVPASSDELDDFIANQMQAQRIPGAAIGVVQRDRVLLRRDYGLANLETETPVRPGTVFDLASVTKPFTAAALLMLMQDGKLRLDDHITTFIAGAPVAWKDITVRHLLSHTSGIRGGGWVESDGSPLLHITAKRYLQDFIGSPLLFAPGHGADYSDPGYFLLGMVIEKVSGLTYRDFMQQRVFGPAGMTSTRIMDRREIVKDHASCYALHNGVIENDRRVWQHDLPSYFGMQSTADDLGRWEIALNRRAPLSAATLEQMWKPATLANGTPARVDGELYGLGYFVQDMNGRRVVGHPGFHGSLILHFPDEDIGIVVLTNLDTDSGPHHLKLALGIAQRLPKYLDPQSGERRSRTGK
jgi:CubicO group peptidase (beta-lactamase class C family)